MSKPKRAEKTQIITANRLGEGTVIYLGADNQWHENIRDAVLLNSGADAALETAALDVAANHIVDPYAIEVSDDHVPLSRRESVRAGGPSVAFGRAANG